VLPPGESAPIIEFCRNCMNGDDFGETVCIAFKIA
jgi:hypothetical protein